MIREASTADAEHLIQLIKTVESQSAFMLMEAGERQTTPEQQRKHLEQMQHQHNSAVFVGEQDGILVAYLLVMGGSVKRTRHAAYLVVGMLEEFRGRGVGTALFEQMEEWAKQQGISRLELTVVTENKAGVALYEKRGFMIEGVKRRSLLVDGRYRDEYMMAKLL